MLFQFRLDEDGQAQDSKVLLSEPKGAFDSAALFFLSKLRFSVPPEWLSTHPNRVIDFGFLYAAGQCLLKDIFPGIESVTVVGWVDFPVGKEERMRRDCQRLRFLQSTMDQPTQ